MDIHVDSDIMPEQDELVSNAATLADGTNQIRRLRSMRREGRCALA